MHEYMLIARTCAVVWQCSYNCIMDTHQVFTLATYTTAYNGILCRLKGQTRSKAIVLHNPSTSCLWSCRCLANLGISSMHCTEARTYHQDSMPTWIYCIEWKHNAFCGAMHRIQQAQCTPFKSLQLFPCHARSSGSCKDWIS